MNITFKKTTTNSLSAGDRCRKRSGLSEILSFDCNSAGCVLVLDSERSVDKTSAHEHLVWSDIDALLSLSEHLDHHLVVSDPWSDLNSVRHDEGVVVMSTDVTEGDGVWLLSASSHAEDLVAVWIVEEVLILSSVGHEK